MGRMKVFLQHPLDDVLRGAYHVEIFVAALYLGEHDFVDIESLIDNTNILACLLLIICLEIFQHSVADVIGPVINFQYLFAGLTGIVNNRKAINDAARQRVINSLFINTLYYFLILVNSLLFWFKTQRTWVSNNGHYL